MNNWIKIFKFTLKQNLRGSKFVASTVLVGIIILIGTLLSNMLISGAFKSSGPQSSNVKAVFIVNETDLELDTESFINKHRMDYPVLFINDVVGMTAEEAASDASLLGDKEAYSIVLEVTEQEDGCVLTVYIPGGSTVSSSDSYKFANRFSETVKNAKIKNTGVTEENLNMAISDIEITEIKAEESDEVDDDSLLTGFAPLAIMMFLYFMLIFYGQSIGSIVSSEKTSKLMEYILTLSGPTEIIFGKVTAVFCEALFQIFIWIACGFCGLKISNTLINSITGGNGKDIIAMFTELLPEGGLSHNFTVLFILSVIALLAAFLFYSFVSALFASFAATVEELTQTTAMSLMIMMAGFIASMYIPLFTDNSPIGLLIVKLVPFTAAFALPGKILCAKISILEFILYIALLLFFTVMLAVLTGRVYKNRLFKKGTTGIFDEILFAITGKVSAKMKSKDLEETEASGKELDVTVYENHDSAKKTYTIVGFGLLALILGANAIGGGLMAGVIANFMATSKNISLNEVYEDVNFLSTANIISMYLLACPACALVMQLANDSKTKIKGHISLNQYLRSIFMMFPLAFGLNYLSTLLASGLSGGEAENSLNQLLGGDNIPAMVMVAVLAPIFEELVFRKLIIDRTIRYGELMSILFSSLAFGLFHCNLYQIFYAFVLGLILGYVYVRTGNVILTIIMHMCVNASSSVLAPLAPQVYEYFFYAMIGLGIVSIIYTLIKRDVKFEKAHYQVPSKELSGIAFVNVGSILFTAVCIVMMIYGLFISTLT